MKVRKISCVFIGVVIGVTFVFMSVGMAREKTPIEIYNPTFEFPKEHITINYWEYFPERVDRAAVEREIAEKYMKLHPNVTVKVTVIPWVGMEVKYSAAFEAGKGPDVFVYFPGVAVPAGYAVSPPDWVIEVFEEKFTPLAQAKMKHMGEWIGWPGGELDADQMLYVNWDMFEEAGIYTYPKTLPELLTVAKKLTRYTAAGEIERVGWGLRSKGAGGVESKFTPFLFCFVDGTKPWVFNEDYSKVIYFDHPGTLEALKFHRDMVFKSKVTSTLFPSPIDAFKLKLAAMTNRETFMAGVLDKDAPDINYKIFPLVKGEPPFGHYTPGVVMAAGHTTMVSKDSKYPQVAWDFSMFLVNDENDLELTKATGGFPRREANIDSDYVKRLFYGWILEEMGNRPPMISPIDPYGILREIQEGPIASMIMKVLEGIETPEEALEKAKRKAVKILEEARRKF